MIKMSGKRIVSALLLVAGIAYIGHAQSPRQYAPDRKVDILHVRIDVVPNFTEKTVAGTVRIDFTPIAKPLTEIQLDSADLSIYHVWSNATISGYTVTDKQLTVTFDPPIEPGREVYLNIIYEAQPKRGLYFRTPDMGYNPDDIQLWTQGESHEGRYWFPNYDYPNERFTSEVICHVPADMTVLSNGRLVSENYDPNTGLKAVHWRQDKPHVNYLIALAAGMFKKIETRYRDIPIAFYTPCSYIDQAANSFEGTADMMGFFEQEIGVPYPWDKYYQVVVDDFVAGGMENTSLTILSTRTLFTDETENIFSSQTLVAHELAHQWFGDYVTCKDWANVWLNEGFATYYENLYDGYHNGHDSFLYQMYSDARRVLDSEGRSEDVRPIYDRTYERVGEQFDYRTYTKGGWVLHTLRSQLGEAVFRKCVRTYLERYALKTVVTADLQSIVEDLSGRSYDQFFDQWIFHAGHPKLDITYEWSQKERLAKISVKQTPPKDEKTLLFNLPTKIRFYVGDKTVDHDIIVAKEQEDFYVPLPAEPNIVRFDPDYTLLAEITFDKPKAMLYQQLKNNDDVIGQILAIEALRKKADKKTVSALKTALNEAPFYGIRVEASKALGLIHTDEAFAALTASWEQSDARVRDRVVQDIGRFYRPETMTLLTSILKSEKNPAIQASAIQNLGRFQDEKNRELIRHYLASDSYRNRLADAAVQAIRQLGDPAFVEPLKQVIHEKENRFTSQGLASALDTLASLAKARDDKTDIYRFISEFINHKKERVKIAAVNALGTLGDARAIAVIETLAQDDLPSPLREMGLGRAAQRALEKLRKETKLVPQEVIELRDTVNKLKVENSKLQERLDDLESRLDAMKRGTLQGP